MFIRLYGDPVLRKMAKEIEPSSLSKEFIREMANTMYVEDGVGLAAPQIGISERFFLYDIGEKLNMIVNPEILEMSNEKEMGEEGCLSIPDIFEKVPRAVRIKVKYYDNSGQEYIKELEGYEARVFQHEFDHLNGKLFIDYISPVKKKLLRQKLNDIKKKSLEVLKKIGKSSARK
jgi:peptide deformylase